MRLRRALRAALRYIGDGFVHFGLSVGLVLGYVPPKGSWPGEAKEAAPGETGADLDRNAGSATPVADEVPDARGASLTAAERRAWRELTRHLRASATFDDRRDT